MMMRAIQRGLRGEPRVGWWANPETQCFVDCPDYLAWLHDRTVLEMQRRGYPTGIYHRTPPEYVPSPAPHVWEDPGFGYKQTTGKWLVRDLSDLLRKWDAEERWDADGYAVLGRRSRKSGRVSQQKWEVPFHLRHWTNRETLVRISKKCEDSQYDQDALRYLVRCRFGSGRST